MSFTFSFCGIPYSIVVLGLKGLAHALKVREANLSEAAGILLRLFDLQNQSEESEVAIQNLKSMLWALQTQSGFQDATEFLSNVQNSLPEDVSALFKFTRAEFFERCSNRHCKIRQNPTSAENDEYILRIDCTNDKQEFSSLVDFQKSKFSECECGLGNCEEKYAYNFDQPMKFLILQLQKMGGNMMKMTERKISGFRPEKVEIRFRNPSANHRNEMQRFRTVAVVKHIGEQARTGHYQCYRKSEKISGWIKLDDLKPRPEATPLRHKLLNDVYILVLEKG